MYSLYIVSQIRSTEVDVRTAIYRAFVFFIDSLYILRSSIINNWLHFAS